MGNITTYEIKSDILSSTIDGEIVLLDVPTGKYFKVDEIGSKIWELITTPQTLDQLINSLMEEYNVTEDQCKSDVSSFLEKLKEYNFLSNQ